MRLLFVAATLAALALAFRPKTKDQEGFELVDVEKVGSSCSSPYRGYAIVDGSLEHCVMFGNITLGGAGVHEYEQFKCTHLRVHGAMVDGKCACKTHWSGPICNKFVGCAASHLHGVCHPTGCSHNGKMAIGSRRMECICEERWQGHRCDSAGCYRLHDASQHKRFIISGIAEEAAAGKCICGPNYEGENCEKVKSCEKTGEFLDGKCVCHEGYGGETCYTKCAKGEITCSTGSVFSAILALPIILQLLNRLF